MAVLTGWSVSGAAESGCSARSACWAGWACWAEGLAEGKAASGAAGSCCSAGPAVTRLRTQRTGHTYTHTHRDPTHSPHRLQPPAKGHVYSHGPVATMVAQAGTRARATMVAHTRGTPLLQVGSPTPTTAGPAFPGASPCLKRSCMQRTHSRRPTSGRYAFRTLATGARSHDGGASADAGCRPLHNGGYMAVRRRSACPNPLRICCHSAREGRLSRLLPKFRSRGICWGQGLGVPRW